MALDERMKKMNAQELVKYAFGDEITFSEDHGDIITRDPVECVTEVAIFGIGGFIIAEPKANESYPAFHRRVLEKLPRQYAYELEAQVHFAGGICGGRALGFSWTNRGSM